MTDLNTPGQDSEYNEHTIASMREDEKDELFEELNDTIDDSFSLHQGLLFHRVNSTDPLEYVAYKNGKQIAFVHSRSYDSCRVGDTVIYDTSDFSLDYMTEHMIENLSGRLQEQIPQEEREKIEDLLKYYDTAREEKIKTSKNLEAKEFYTNCGAEGREDGMAQLINRYIQKVGEENIGELDDVFKCSNISREKVGAIEEKIKKSTST